MPDGAVFACITVEDGKHVYTDTWGWEFQKD